MAWGDNYFVPSLYAVRIIASGRRVEGSQTESDSGHGTYVENEEVVASVAGTIERVNKLVTVRAIRTKYVLAYIDSPTSQTNARYNPEVGDLVVGRITEVRLAGREYMRKNLNGYAGTAASVEGRRKLPSRCGPYAVFSKFARWCAGMVT